MLVKDLISHLDTLLEVTDFKDASYNGLQIGDLNASVSKIATACTASLEAIDAAVESKADTLIVHHGLFWKGADPRLVGNFYQRVKTLIDNNINLIAYHLPLDAHLSLGNNAHIAHILGAEHIDYIVPNDKTSIGMRVKLSEALSVEEIANVLAHRLDTRVRIIGNLTPDILLDDLAICTGSGSFLLDNNKTADFQALITGDVNEQTFHMANETGTLVFEVGHHASEQEAINALGDKLAQDLKLEHQALHFSYERNVPIIGEGECEELN